MLLKTILNRMQKYKGFVYNSIGWNYTLTEPTIDAHVVPRANSRPRCGILVEHLPWAVGKHRLTQAYAWYLSRWAKRLSWEETAQIFSSSWYHVFHSVEMAVN